MSVAKRKIDAARSVAEYLETIGQKKRAEDIRSLCRSASSLVETCSRLSKDNAELRSGK